MKNRFALSVVGLAGATVGVAHAQDQNIQVVLHLDYWASESSSEISGNSGSFGHYVSGGYVYAYNSRTDDYGLSVSFSAWSSMAGAYTSGYRLTMNAGVDSGTMFAVLDDSYGDGWAWNSVPGSDAFVVTGVGDTSVSGSTTVSLDDGYSNFGSFVVSGSSTPVVPGAPAAAALLGLAGIAVGRRKRG